MDESDVLIRDDLNAQAWSAANIKELKRRMASIGYEVVTDRGDHKKIKEVPALKTS